jgi:hypothetical protein
VIRVEDFRGMPSVGVQPKEVFFRYKVEGDEREASMVTSSVDQVSQWKKGRPVDVLYLDGRAVLVEVQPAQFPFPTAVFLLFALMVWLLIGVPSLTYALVGIRRKYQLLKNGVVRQGKLLSFETLSSFLSWTPTGRFRATYTYIDSAARELLDTAPSRDLTLLNQKKKGDEIDILVLPTDERRSTILDSSTERVLLRTASHVSL